MTERSEPVQQRLEATKAANVFTPAERIHQLNDIDKVGHFLSLLIPYESSAINMSSQDVARLLHAAGQAVKSLTNQPPLASNNPEEPVTIEAHKESFSNATAEYFSLLSSINVRLRRQIYALEEADIIASDSISKDGQVAGSAPAFGVAAGGGAGGVAAQAEKGEISGIGLGNLDVGWLNSRSDTVGREMEGEIWAKAREFLERLEQRRSGNTRNGDNDEMDAVESR
jgi:Mediator complex protein